MLQQAQFYMLAIHIGDLLVAHLQVEIYWMKCNEQDVLKYCIHILCELEGGDAH